MGIEDWGWVEGGVGGEFVTYEGLVLVLQS